MIKKPVCLVRRSVKTVRNMEVLNSWIHGGKCMENFGFRMFDFGFFTRGLAVRFER